MPHDDQRGSAAQRWRWQVAAADGWAPPVTRDSAAIAVHRSADADADLGPDAQAAAPPRIAHDLTNLLFVVTGQIHAIRKRLASSDPALAELDLLERAALRMKGLAAALQGARPDACAADRRGVIDLREWLAGAVHLLERLLPASIVLHADLSPQAPLWCWADSLALDRVMSNLLVNARAAMPRGGEIFIHLRPLIVGDVRTAVLVVRDTGPGMDPVVRRRVFKSRVSTRTDAPGHGQGLLIVRDIVKAHQGEVTLTSRPGMGVEVCITLPTIRETPEG